MHKNNILAVPNQKTTVAGHATKPGHGIIIPLFIPYQDEEINEPLIVLVGGKATTTLKPVVTNRAA